MYTHKVKNNLPIRGQFIVSTAIYIYNVLHRNTRSNILVNTAEDIHRHTTRASQSIRPAQATNNYGLKSMLTFGPKVYNKIPADIKRSKHQHAFKWVLKCHLRSENFISKCFEKDFLNFMYSDCYFQGLLFICLQTIYVRL